MAEPLLAAVRTAVNVAINMDITHKTMSTLMK